MQTTDCANHPSNMDPTAELVSSGREPFSIFRVRGGFVGILNGFAFVDLFPSQDAARNALTQVGGF